MSGKKIIKREKCNYCGKTEVCKGSYPEGCFLEHQISKEPTTSECKHLKTFMRGKIITCSDCKKPFY